MLTWSNTVATANGVRLINSLASFNNLVNGDRQVASCVSVAFDLMGMNGEAGVSIVQESNLW
jgi:hypothetical protein